MSDDRDYCVACFRIGLNTNVAWAVSRGEVCCTLCYLRDLSDALYSDINVLSNVRSNVELG